VSHFPLLGDGCTDAAAHGLSEPLAVTIALMVFPQISLVLL
jgi:hypothetical protein